MPPACRFTREQIVAAALAITRERGFDAVTARAIADTLHSSSKVIFSAFSGMDDLLAATIDAADAQYRAYSADFVRDSADPPYKAVGTAYIRFARNEPNLFHLLYMRDRRREDHSGDAENIAVLVDFLMAKLHITREDATLLHIGWRSSTSPARTRRSCTSKCGRTSTALRCCARPGSRIGTTRSSAGC